MMITLLLVCLFLAAPNWRKKDWSPFEGFVYAHRGAFDNETGVMENSMEAFMRAAERGDGMELDVQLTRDGVPVVFHDKTLSRLYGVDKAVCDLDYEKLRFLPRFSDVLKKVDGRVPLVVELKAYNRIYLLCEKVWAELSAYHGAYMVESFSTRIVGWFRFHAPKVIRGQLLSKPGIFLMSIIGRPDFFACAIGMEKGLAFKVIKRVFNPVMIAWTIRTKAQRQAAQAHYNMQIFEDPR